MSNGEAAGGDGTTLSIGGTTFAKGIGMHAPGKITVWLGGACTRFLADVGVDDEVTRRVRWPSTCSATTGRSPAPEPSAAATQPGR